MFKWVGLYFFLPYLNIKEGFTTINKTFIIMKKKILLLTCVGLLISSVGFAQTNDNATLNVVLSSVQSITVNAAQKTVNLNFTTTADYTSGVSSLQTDHLAVVSTVDFDVTAIASQDLTQGVNTIPINTITLQAAAGTGAPATASYPLATLSTATANNIIDAADADLDANFNVTYAASGGASYNNVPGGTYTTTITYTLVAN